METKWNKEPPKVRYGVSQQHIVLTNRGAFNTGYYYADTGEWSCEGLLLRGERVVAFLDGIDVPALTAPKEEEKKPDGIPEYTQDKFPALL